MMLRNLILLTTTLFSAAAASLHAAPANTPHVEAELVLEHQTVQPGSAFNAGLRLDMKPGWHTYWKFGGDGGLQTKVAWTLPDGMSVDEILWPRPISLNIDGLINLVYEDEVILPIPMKARSDASAGDTDILKAEVSWLVCSHETCVPEKVKLSFEIPYDDKNPEPDPAWETLFTTAWQDQPMEPGPWNPRAVINDSTIQLRVTIPPGSSSSLEGLEFMPDQYGIILLAEPQDATADDESITVLLQRDPNGEEQLERLTGILIRDAGWDKAGLRTAMAIDIPFTTALSTGEKTPSAETKSIGLILFLAFVGGLILNLMPCVFPVLGLKIISFVKQAGEDRKLIKLHGSVFTLGVLVSFWILAGILIGLRTGGQELGWGFQLQSPAFVITLAAVLLLFALSLSGLFEIGLKLTSTGQNLSGKSGLAGSFFSGILATVVATPCAAPILAPALGAALALNPVPSMLVFTAMAVGLALPYLLLSIFPDLLNRLPKPGAWMETFKQLMAFLLYASAAYLIWVVEGQVSSNGFLAILFGLVTLSMACWFYGHWQMRPGKARTRGRILALLSLAAALLLFKTGLKPDAVKWEPWSASLQEELVEDGQAVYVDFTARWCTTCQVNKKAVFSSEEVLETIREKGIRLLKADWTNQDPEITRALESYGRSAVPFNLFFPGNRKEPVVLPEVLTAGVVLDIIRDSN